MTKQAYSQRKWVLWLAVLLASDQVGHLAAAAKSSKYQSPTIQKPEKKTSGVKSKKGLASTKSLKTPQNPGEGHKKTKKKKTKKKSTKKSKSEAPISSEKPSMQPSTDNTSRPTTKPASRAPTLPPTEEPSNNPTSLFNEDFEVAFWEYGYLVKDDAPEALGGVDDVEVASGTKINGAGGAPLTFVPHLGCSAMAPMINPQTQKVDSNQVLCLSLATYGNRSNSPDYPVHIPTIDLGSDYEFGPNSNGIIRYETTFVFDQNARLSWENGADVALEMFIPDDSWGDFLLLLRALTGADFDPQSLVIPNAFSGIIADGYSPILLPLDLSSFPIVAFPFLRVPDITSDRELSADRLAISAEDKSFCDLDALYTGQCQFGDDESSQTLFSDTLPEDSYTIVKGGFGGMALLDNGLVAGFFKLVQQDEPGIRVYEIASGPCTESSCSPPSVSDFMGFYSLEAGSEFVSDVSLIPGSSSIAMVLESEALPLVSDADVDSRFIYCLVNLNATDSEGVFDKRCILDNDYIYERLDTSTTSGDSAERPVRGGGMLVLDQFCFLATSDSNFPQSTVTRELGFLMKICFSFPMFNNTYLTSSIF